MGRFVEIGPGTRGYDAAVGTAGTETITLLGSGGWIPTSQRATCAALVRRGDRALLIDAGTGVSRLVESPALLDGVAELEIVLTHFHLDHVVGLAYLPELPLARPPRLHGPGEALYDTSTAAILGRLVGPPLFALPLDALAQEVVELDPDRPDVAGFELAARIQTRHSDPTLALRVGDSLSYCTDTAYDEDTAAFARGSRVLAHEAWFTEDQPREASTHCSAGQAAQLAREAGVDDLVLIHIRPGADEAALAREAQEVFETTKVGTDLLTIG
jgi:ribonuclease BN (tRNA processing enzyme)